MENELNYGQFISLNGNVLKKNIRVKALNYSSADADIKPAGIYAASKKSPVPDDVLKKNQDSIEKRRKKRAATINKNIKKSKKLAARLQKFKVKLQKKETRSKIKKTFAEQKARQKQISASLGRSRSSIGIKLVSIISSLVIISLGLITFLVSVFVSGDTKINAEDNNLTINSRTASDTEHRLNSVSSNVGMFLDLLRNSQSDEEVLSNTAMFFKRNQDIAAVVLPDDDEIYVNKTFFVRNELSENLLTDYLIFESE